MDYSLPVYFNSLTAKQKAKLEKIQYTAAKIVSGALHNTSRVSLNEELAWESIDTRAQFLGLTIFHKIVKNETRPLIRECLLDLFTTSDFTSSSWPRLAVGSFDD